MISVVMPCYEAARWLPETLAALAGQSWRDAELVVVEDGSDDGTRGLVEAFGQAHGWRVLYHRHAENRGLSAARNTGLRMAQGEAVAFLDHDDLWLPDHLTELMAARRRSGAELVFTGAQLFDDATGEDRELWIPSAAEQADYGRALWGRNFIQPSATLIDTLALRALGGFAEEIQYTQDIECWLRAVRAGWRLEWTGGATLRYRKHAQAMSARTAWMAEWKARVLWKHRDWPVVTHAEWRRRLAAQWGLASRLHRAERPGRAARCALWAARCGPPRLRALAWAGWWGLRSLLGGPSGQALPPTERC